MSASRVAHGLYARRILSVSSALFGMYLGYRLAVWLRLPAGLQVVALCVATGVSLVIAVRVLLSKPAASSFVDTTEDEFRKLTWPSSNYLKRATAVVIVIMAGFGAVLFAYDLVWQKLFSLVGFLQLSS